MAVIDVCRAALERIVAERSARYSTPEDLDEMAAAIRDARRSSLAGDHASVVSANTRFHDRMLQSARMTPLRQLLDTIRSPILVARHRMLADSPTSPSSRARWSIMRPGLIGPSRCCSLCTLYAREKRWGGRMEVEEGGIRAVARYAVSPWGYSTVCGCMLSRSRQAWAR